jgi:hypothetical protein
MKAPLKELLGRSEPDRATVERVWAGVRAGERRRGPLLLAVAAGLLAIVAATVLAVSPREQALTARATPVVGVTLEPLPGAVASTKVRDGVVTLRLVSGQVHVAVQGEARCVVETATLHVEVAAATARFSAGEGEQVYVEEGQLQVREHTVRAGGQFSTVATWRELARRGDFPAAWQLLGPAGITSEALGATAEERTLLADIAATGHALPLAISLLEGVVASPSSSPERALAAYDLGLRLLEHGEPARAATAFELALDLELPRALADDARARAAEAWLRAGDTARARRWLDAAERAP